MIVGVPYSVMGSYRLTVSCGHLAPYGADESDICAIETGKYDPSLPLAFRAARLFALRIEEIFQDEDRGTVATEIKKNTEDTYV